VLPGEKEEVEHRNGTAHTGNFAKEILTVENHFIDKLFLVI
jgi:hypothetical protein